MSAEHRPLQGRAAIITGGNQGLGLAIAEAYVDAGADVMLCARDRTKLEGAREQLAKRARSDQQVLAEPLNVSDEAAVRAFVERAIVALPHVCVLVNNAGIYGPKGSIDVVSQAEWVHTVQINLFGSV